jgi:arginine/lysine/ornithine decarboxylase
VKDAISLFSSTSPSYLTLASLDLANRAIADEYTERLAATVTRIAAVKECLRHVGFCVPDCEPLKIVIRDASAEALASSLRLADIECEFVDRTHLVLMASAENKLSDFDVLERVLLPLGKEACLPDLPPKPSLGTPALSLREALFAPVEEIRVTDAIGRVYAETCASCPPAVPIAICGERITEETVRAFLYYGIETVRVTKNR